MPEATQDAAQVVRAHADMWNAQNYSKIPEVISETYVEYNPAMPEGEIHGRDGFEAWMDAITTAFPDFEAEILDVLADGGTAMAELKFTMTQEGEFDGVPPTGKTAEFRGMATFRVEDGTVRELRNYLDTRTLFDQLGPGEDGE